MLRERESGKVRAIGFSCHDRPLATTLAKELPADVVMIRYNVAHRGAEREIFAPLAELGERRPGPLAPARREEIRRFGDAVHAGARRGMRWMFGRSSS